MIRDSRDGMDGTGKPSPEKSYEKEVFLRVAAYRATHQGRLPPVNSNLWREHMHFAAFGGGGGPGHRPCGLLLRFLRRAWPWLGNPEKVRQHTRPLAPFKLEKPFLTDDYRPEKVEAWLEAWPMIAAFAMVERHSMGEWFIYCIEVLAEDLPQAVRIVECIFALPCPAAAGEAAP